MRLSQKARNLSPSSRCLVPFTAFSEPGRDAAGKYRPIWFKLAGDDPLADPIRTVRSAGYALDGG